MSKAKVGSFGLRGIPHSIERKTYGSEGKELMNFKMHNRQFLTTFSTSVMEQVELAVTHGMVVWVFGDIVEAPGYGDNSDKTYTNFDATAAILDTKSKPQPQADSGDGLPF